MVKYYQYASVVPNAPKQRARLSFANYGYRQQSC